MGQGRVARGLRARVVGSSTALPGKPRLGSGRRGPLTVEPLETPLAAPPGYGNCLRRIPAPEPRRSALLVHFNQLASIGMLDVS